MSIIGRPLAAGDDRGLRVFFSDALLRVRPMSLFARAVKLIGISSLFAVALLLHSSRDRTVQVWQTDPTVAWTRRTLDVGTSDEPILHAALRSVVVRRDRLRPGYGAELVAGLAVYDDEGDRPGHDRRQYVRMSPREPALRYRGHLRDPTTGATMAVDGVRYRWTYSHEVVFDVADSFRWPDAGAVELLITVAHGDDEGTVVASFPVVLAPVATPTATLAICTKPLYSDPTPDPVSRIAQCASSW